MQTVTVCIASSFNWASLITPAIVLVSVGVAVMGVRSARASVRQKATLDLIEKTESTLHYRDLHSTFAYHRRQNSFSRLHAPTEERDRSERQKILDYLNHYEIVSIGIRNNIIDARIYKNWMGGPFVRDWNAAADFIQRERWKWDTDSRTWRYYAPMFEHFQAVATSWSPDAIALTETYSGPPCAPTGPGDEAFPGRRAW